MSRFARGGDRIRIRWRVWTVDIFTRPESGAMSTTITLDMRLRII